VGDTLGPGGVMRGLRPIPLLLDICADLDDVVPDALLLNYVTPMAPLGWAAARVTGARTSASATPRRDEPAPRLE